MIHAVRVKDGKASYANRYVHTKKLETERKFGHSLYLKVRMREANGICVLSNGIHIYALHS